MKILKNIFNSVASQLPVIGPHAGIEADLMLAGKKPLTWIAVYPDELSFPNHPVTQKEHEDRKRLDEAVRQGKLKSCDVVVSEGFVNPWVSRHYCQPDKEADMRLLAAHNEKDFNRKRPDVELKKDVGEYLGYRDRDVKLWHMLGRLPKPMVDFIFSVNRNITQPAYQARMLGSVKKDPAP